MNSRRTNTGSGRLLSSSTDSVSRMGEHRARRPRFSGPEQDAARDQRARCGRATPDVGQGQRTGGDGIEHPVSRGGVECSPTGRTTEPLSSPAGLTRPEGPLAPVAHWRRTHRGSALATSISSSASLGTRLHACLSIVRDAREELLEIEWGMGELELERQCSGTRATACQRVI